MQHTKSAIVSTLCFLIATACMGNEVGHLEAEPGDLTLGEAPRGAYNAALTPVCGFPNVAAGNDIPVVYDIDRRPYLQRVTDRGAWVMWTSDDGPADVSVTTADGTEVAFSPGELDSSASLPDGEQYVAELDGLEPATTYCYRVYSASGALIEQAGFRTAPQTGSAEPVRFVALGDLGTGEIDQYAVLEQLGTVQYDLALITGDVAYDNGTLQQFETNFFGVYADLLRHIPFFPASGNHDYETADAAAFRQVFGLFENGGDAGHERWYSFDWGMVHVAVLDSQKISQTQVDWLDADLAANDSAWTIVIGHNPPYSSGSHGSHTKTREMFGPVMVKHEVDLGLWGHDHHYERIDAGNGVKHIVTGAGGRGTRPVGSSSWTEHADQVSHFVYGVADEDKLSVWAIDATGATFDTFELTR